MGLGGQRDIPGVLTWDSPSAHSRGRQGGHQVRSGRVWGIKIILPKEGSSKGFWKVNVINMVSVYI
jgi:hypothetical protein